MYALVVGGLLLLAAEWLKPKKPSAEGLDDITYRRAFMIGCFQCGAVAGLLPFGFHYRRRYAGGREPLCGVRVLLHRRCR